MMSTQRSLNVQKLAERLREKSLDRQNKTIRMTKFPNSDQATDLSLPSNCEGFGRVHHFRLKSDPNWVIDPLPILPACKYLNIPITDVLLAQVFQLSACDFRCWYCFVDFSLLSADPKHSEMVMPKQLLQMMLNEKVNSQVIDLSGGQPELVPEYVFWFLQSRAELGLEKSYFVWADDNLSTDHMWRCLSEKEISFMINTPGFARVGCLKGFDAESFTFNTSADGRLFKQQIDLLDRFVRAGFDQYGYITITTMNTDDLQSKMARLLDAIQNRVHPNFPLRIVPLRISGFNANRNRYNKQAEENQFRALDAWLTEMQRRFNATELAIPITDVNIKRSMESMKQSKQHIAIFIPPFLDLILERRKIIEGRFSKVRCAPFGVVKEGDTVLMKDSGGPIRGSFLIAKVENFENLTQEKLEELKTRYSEFLCADFDPQYWQRRRDSRYATLLHVTQPTRFEQPLPFPKKDRRGWVVLDKPILDATHGSA